MCIRLVKRLRMAVLFAGFVSWQWIADYEFALRLVVGSSAVVVAIQAFRAARYRWMIGATGFSKLALRVYAAPPSLVTAARCLDGWVDV